MSSIFHRFTCFLVFILIATHANLAPSQGKAVILPMSNYVSDWNKPIVFTVYNQTDTPQEMTVDFRCEVDGEELSDDKCSKLFELSTENGKITRKLSIQPSSKVSVSTYFRGKASNFAFFKPLISPTKHGASPSSPAGFQFRYQPGYLFTTIKAKPTLEVTNFSIAQSDEGALARFQFDTSKMTAPSVASISAKLVDRKSSKLIRFVRLANDKMIDPRRGILNLESPFAAKGFQGDVCFEIITQWAIEAAVDRVDGCSRAQKPYVSAPSTPHTTRPVLSP